MRNRLTLLERLYLNWCAWRDVKRNAFHPEYIYDSTGIEEVDHFIASEFISMELANMEAARNAARLKKPVFFRVPACGCRLRVWKLRSAAAALNIIATTASLLHTDIQLSFAAHNAYTREIDDRLQDYADLDALHYTRLYQNKNRKKARKIFVKLKRLYHAQLSLHSCALEILRKTQNTAQWFQTRYFLRIRYYYQCASSKDPRIPIQYLGDDRLMAIANTSPAYPFETLMAKLQEQIDALMQDLQKLSA